MHADPVAFSAFIGRGGPLGGSADGSEVAQNGRRSGEVLERMSAQKPPERTNRIISELEHLGERIEPPRRRSNNVFRCISRRIGVVARAPGR